MAKSKSKYEIEKFLRDNKRNGDFTHTALPNPPENFAGSYTISDDKYNKFLDLYHNSVFVNKNNAYLTERHLDYSPILIDLDFRFSPDKKKRQYDDNFITTFLEIYLEYIEEIININNIELFILEKNKPKFVKDKNLVKDGIHIMIPDIVTFPRIQYILRYRVIHDERVQELFDSINITNDIQDIIDICVIEKNNWQLYGSRKPNCEAYEVTKLYSYKNNTLQKIKNNYTDRILLDKLSIRNIDKNSINTINEDAFESLDKDYDTMPGNFKMKKKTKLVKTTPKKKRDPSIPIENCYSIKELETIVKLVDILDKSRAESHDSWIRVGWCLHNIDERLLQSWINFSEKSEKCEIKGIDHGRSKERCEYLWDNMESNGLGVGTLYMWAKEDNYGKYKELTVNNLRKLLLKSLSSAHNDIAKVLHSLYKDEFIYGKSKCWYQFRNHRWIRINDGINLRLKISNELVNEYLKFNIEIGTKAQQIEDDDAEKELLLERMKKISSIILKLKANSFKKNIMEEIIELFYNEKFEELLDTNTHLICFNNGVYDLDSALFRKGIPEDYISFNTNTDYIEYDSSDDIIQDVNNFVQQVIPNKPVREYLLTLLSSFLDGKISEEKFHIWTGSGGNGKSKLIELFQNGFGDYCTVLPCSLITQKRGRSEACNPALTNSKGKRFACFQEPDSKDRINVALMKELTGGDKITTRGLYKDQETFKPQFKPVLTCNNLPKPDDNDEGTWRRIRLVQFLSKFRDKPDPNKPDEFMIDKNLAEKLYIWAEPFMYILLEYYKIYKAEGLYEPEDIMINTQLYRNDSDDFALFFNEKIEIIENFNGESIHIDEAYYIFKEWFSLSYGNSKCPSRKELKQNMIKKYGNSDKDGNIFKALVWKTSSESHSEPDLALDI